jgi:type I restriction enzyme S subunit
MPISALAEQVRGVSYAKQDASGTPGDGLVPILRAGNINDDGIVLDDLVYVPRRCVSADQMLRRHDVLIATSSGSLDVVGKAAYVSDDVDAAFGAFCKVLRPTPSIEPRFFAYYFRTAEYRRTISRLAAGANINNLRNEHLDDLLIPVPPLERQRCIADTLDKADAIRRKRKEALALTEELLRSAFLEMVGPGARDYSKWPAQTVAELAARSPNAMRTGPFGSDLRHSEFVDEGIAVLGIDNAVQNRFTWGERRFITQEKYERLRRYTVFPGDVIVTIMGTTGRSAVVPDGIPTAITTKHLATITLEPDRATPEFVSQALFRHPQVLRQISAANRGAIMSGLNLGLIKALSIPVPPIERQREFAALTARVRALAEKMSGARDADVLFDSLVSSAFSQRVEVGAAC